MTMDSLWAQPAWPGLKILVRVGDTPAAALPGHRPDLPDTTSDWRSVHLTRPFAPLPLLQLVLDRLDRHRQLQADCLLFSPRRLDAAACAAAQARIKADRWLVDLEADAETGTLTRLLIGPGYVTNPLFAQFFRALHDPEALSLPTVLEQMAHYLGPQTQARTR